jgi:tetratricopeptide (TPR) repeat protein
MWRAILLLCAGPVLAQDCPPPPDREAERRALMAELRAAPGPAEAGRTSAMLWEIWADAPDARAQAMLDLGRSLIARRQLGQARAALDGLVDYCPDYAEGWNQRAFAAFLAQDLEAALADLDRARELSPEHLGVLSGRAMTLMGLGRDEEGQAQLREALRLNPWLAERSLLEGPPEREL